MFLMGTLSEDMELIPCVEQSTETGPRVKVAIEEEFSGEAEGALSDVEEGLSAGVEERSSVGAEEGLSDVAEEGLSAGVEESSH
jgi:flagellar biosynthesis/type III secretory pathway protein FliH